MNNHTEADEIIRLRADVERLRRLLLVVESELGGWRELVAELDELPKSEVIGKAMWAALDQMDRFNSEVRQALAATRPKP